MINIFVGLIFVFFKTNLSFWDIGVTYYITNIIGYVSIFFGIIELGRTNQTILKVKPYVIIMIAHSIFFFLLNLTGNSPLSIAMSTTSGVIVAVVGVVFIIVGMFMVFIIIFQLLDSLATTNIKLLYNLVNVMSFLLILAGISAIFNFVPMIATTIMGALLLLEVLFLISYYYIFLTKNEKYA
ncbi:hypothetical protein H8S33_05470 [Ornithinibacillus sp. BX22]|uniref:Uncharacterized protein n=1 Tax=Ornithinibacillus hominis TaxID=2763055 RepID=A0A923RJC1_9BACI|nr:hypothetical protein [Ornithinibacillus hominis]MBC5636277.1 hypothetical protein [Ornithinibacillus hominis]